MIVESPYMETTAPVPEIETDKRYWTDEEMAEFDADVQAKRAARGFVPSPPEELQWGPIETLPNGIRIQKQVRRTSPCT